MTLPGIERIRGLLQIALVFVVLIPPAGSARPVAGGPPPLTNEDIVRLVTNGTAEKAILDAIAARAADFDLSPGVVDELKAVGVGERILEAMRGRQAAMPRPEPPPPPTVPAADLGRVAIVFEGAPDPKTSSEGLAIAVRAMPGGAHRPGGVEVGEVTDLALAILCTTADHVPDHWDTRTPIAGGPRHEVILFHPGSRPARIKGFDVLYLDRDGIGPAPLPAGRHTLLVALAGKQAGSGSWRLLASDTARAEVRSGQTVAITLRAHGRLRGTVMTGFNVDQEWKVASVEPPPGSGVPEASTGGLAAGLR